MAAQLADCLLGEYTVMEAKSRRARRQRWGAASAAVATLALIGGKKAYDYSAAPSEPPSCDFTYPIRDSSSRSEMTFSASPEAVATSHLDFVQLGGTLNDASCLNRTPIYGMVRISSVGDVTKALAFAREHHLKVTSAGRRHSMGGQAFCRGSLVLDMRSLNAISVDRARHVMTVQAGATWGAIQQYLDGQGLAVKAMQSINIFTVGGTLSVNAHGIAHRPGSVAPTVKAIHIMLSDGEIKRASPDENSDLFRHALGGYGLFGVILDAEIEVVDNELYRQEVKYIDYRDFVDLYRASIRGDDQTGLIYARLSVSPSSYLREVAVHRFLPEPTAVPLPPLQPDSLTTLTRFALNLSKTGKIGRWLRWEIERRVSTRLDNCATRNQSLAADQSCDVTRNQEMHDSMGYLSSRLNDTNILQEYFVSAEMMTQFVDGMREIITEHGANLINVTIRAVQADSVTALPYAKQDALGFVLYFNQDLTEVDCERLKATTIALIDLSTKLKGRFYLPYQLYYTREQLLAAYPEAADFFVSKQDYDRIGLFSNQFYEKYGTVTAQ